MAVAFQYYPHEAQREIHCSRDRRFRTVCCGRRWGKTKALAGEILDRAGGEVAGDYGWIAPTYLIAERGIDALRDIAGEFVRFHGQNPVVAEITGPAGTSRIFFLSADRPNSILGFGFRGIVLDEAARIPADTWHSYIRPTLSDHLGWGVFISTPKGRNWFFDAFTRGLDPEEEEWGSFTFPSNTNPYFADEEFEEARRTLPEMVFRQEYEAEFLADSSGVFNGIESCLWDGAPIRKGRVNVGLDLAKHQDFTVLTALDIDSGHFFEMERFNKYDWPFQRQKIEDFCRRVGGTLVMDATGVGDPLYDDLRQNLRNVEPVKLTNVSKTQLIQSLMVSIERGRIHWPRKWEVLTNELMRYEYLITSNGNLTYNAPSGYHDDCVIAMALANSKLAAAGHHPRPPVRFNPPARRTGRTFSTGRGALRG